MTTRFSVCLRRPAPGRGITQIGGLFLALSCAWSIVAAERHIALLPVTLVLSSQEARQTLVVQWEIGGEFQHQATRGMMLTSSDENVVRLENGQAIPVANGKATIAATVDGQTATADV